ncbi:FIST N-terminal domain-containing protein [Sinorhizobium sp. BJ1]|uniref:FIST N-terminal domain-containing protein n=1 Tax=Sinorhizobium sp. BJ1 TaxID=2035455 RepID=UPI000BEAE2EC|nr:FIST N-terminal domain-containing protein [Sinorhizobium sp. BJ1]PDT81274.1 GfdT protein [Sinorhizobium sp. BJ1]
MRISGGSGAVRDAIVRRASTTAGDPNAVETLSRQLGSGPFSLIMLFMSPAADLVRLPIEAARVFDGVPIVGCTTAGEISDAGYDEGTIVALALPTEYFRVDTVTIPDLMRLDPPALAAALVRTRTAMAQQYPELAHEFAMLLVDGLSQKEDELTSALAAGLGATPMLGGSAGDGTRFERTFVLDGHRLSRNAAVLALVRTECSVRVFNFDHLIPTEKRMVVTEADPHRRIVRQINAEPAAREYARLVGKDPQQLTPFTFAANPVAVRMGTRHHVRAIRQVMENGDLVFFSAIDEGVVLTITEPADMHGQLKRELAGLCMPERPTAILAFDCILRRLEAEEKQVIGRVSGLLRRYGVIGFSTYGEQFGPMHVNQTMTGLAIYPPGTALPEKVSE